MKEKQSVKRGNFWKKTLYNPEKSKRVVVSGIKWEKVGLLVKA